MNNSYLESAVRVLLGLHCHEGVLLLLLKQRLQQVLCVGTTITTKSLDEIVQVAMRDVVVRYLLVQVVTYIEGWYARSNQILNHDLGLLWKLTVQISSVICSASVANVRKIEGRQATPLSYEPYLRRGT